MSAFDQVLAFGIGRALYGGSDAREREAEREQREKQHQEMLEAIQKAKQANSSSRNLHEVEKVATTTANSPNLNGVKPYLLSNNKLCYQFSSGEFFIEEEKGRFSAGVQCEGTKFIQVILPAIGAVVKPGQPMVVLKSTEDTEETRVLYAPISGIVVHLFYAPHEVISELCQEKAIRLYFIITEEVIRQDRRQNRLRAANGKQLIAACERCNAQLVFEAEDTWTLAKCIECGNEFFLQHKDDIATKRKKENDVPAKEKAVKKKAVIHKKKKPHTHALRNEMKVACPHCDGNVIFSIERYADYAGVTVPCPHCTKTFQLPRN